MNCARVRALFDAFYDGRLDEEQRRRVSDHLDACPDCAAQFSRMERLLSGVRGFPRPPAPALELEIPVGGASSLSGPRRRIGLHRAAAAVLLFAALGATHVLAFSLGERRNRDLAEIARRELPRLVSGHLDETATHLGFARQVAAEEPGAMDRLVFNDPLGRELRERSNALVRLVATDPPLESVRASFEHFVRDQNELYATRGAGELRRRIAQLEQELTELKNHIGRLRGGPPSVGYLPGDPEAVASLAIRLLVQDGRPDEAARIVAAYAKRGPVTRMELPMIYILGESARQLGEIPESDVVMRLLRQAGADGRKVFFASIGTVAGGATATFGWPRTRTGGFRLQIVSPGAGHGQVVLFRQGQGTVWPVLPARGLEILDLLRGSFPETLSPSGRHDRRN